MAQLSGSVVVHAAEQNYPLRFGIPRHLSWEKIRDSKLEHSSSFSTKDIFALDAESGGIPFRQNLRFISADVLFHKSFDGYSFPPPRRRRTRIRIERLRAKPIRYKCGIT